MSPNETFDLNATVAMVFGAFKAVICTIGFQAAVHGLCVALVIAVFAFISLRRKGKAARPLFVVFKKMSIFCAVLAIPGGISLLTSGKLPQVNHLELNSFGLIAFWALVTAHLCMEEMNFQFFDANKEKAFPMELLENADLESEYRKSPIH
jgi:hypothetical protein